MLTVIRYIEGNAVRANMVSSATQWNYSSHNERVSGEAGILSELPIVLPDEWTRFVDEPLTDAELEKLRNSVNRQTPYGGSEWQVRISNKLGLSVTMNPRGRPKKSGAEKQPVPVLSQDVPKR